MAHRTVRWCTGHDTVQCPVRAMSAAHWGLEQLIVEVLCLLAAPESLVAHQTYSVRSNFAALTFDYAMFTFVVDRCAHLTVALLAHWTLSGAHHTVR